MSDDQSFVYDRVPYPSYLHPQTSPERLATLATLFGLTPAPPDRARVLEIGAGDGTSLLTFALLLPESRFVGIDLSAAAVERGQARAASLDLTNVELRCADVQEIGDELGAFDYVVAHGFYSWVPAPVRAAALELISRSLEPHGVAYVSYACYPGAHLREAVRGMLRLHAGGRRDPVERVRQARALADLLERAQDGSGRDAYRELLRTELADLRDAPDAYVLHDMLAPVLEPAWFHEMVAHAARHDLAFLAEADLFEMSPEALPQEVRAALVPLARDPMALEQYLDFAKCRRFRQSLFVRSSQRVERAVPIERMRHFRFATSARPVSGAVEVGAREIDLVGRAGARARTDDPQAVAALASLLSAWPSSMSFDELAARAPGDRDELSAILLSTWRAGIVDGRLLPPRFVTSVSDHPVASPLARLQAAEAKGDAEVSSLQPATEVLDETDRRLVSLLDGSLGSRELAPLLSVGLPEVERRLSGLARRALLAS